MSNTKFDKQIPNEESQRTMGECRARVHKWEKINRVIFDADKEHSVVIHPLQGEGDPFKLLGCLVDCKIIMQQIVDKMLSQIRPKVKAILRTKPYYDQKNLVSQFERHPLQVPTRP